MECCRTVRILSSKRGTIAGVFLSLVKKTHAMGAITHVQQGKIHRSLNPALYSAPLPFLAILTVAVLHVVRSERRILATSTPPAAAAAVLQPAVPGARLPHGASTTSRGKPFLRQQRRGCWSRRRNATAALQLRWRWKPCRTIPSHSGIWKSDGKYATSWKSRSRKRGSIVPASWMGGEGLAGGTDNVHRP